MTIREIIEKSKLKELVDVETLQNCIIALSDLVYILKTEPSVKMCYFGLTDDVRNKMLKNMKDITEGCYSNDPVSYSGKDHVNPEFWKKMNRLGDKLINNFKEKVCEQ